jgi:hypothetical protein
MNDDRRRGILFAIITLSPFLAFAVINFAPWWVSAPFAFLAFVWWFGALLLIGDVNRVIEERRKRNNDE